VVQPLLLSLGKHGLLGIHIQGVLVTDPILKLCEIVQGQQIPLYELRYLGQRLELVDVGKMKVAVEMRIVVLLVLYAAAQSYAQSSDAAHGQHIVAEVVAARRPAPWPIALWTLRAHTQAR